MEQDQLANVRIVFDDEHAPCLARARGRGGAIRGFPAVSSPTVYRRRRPARRCQCHGFVIGQPRSVKNGRIHRSFKRKSLALLAMVLPARILGAFYARRGDDAPLLTTEAASSGDIVTSFPPPGRSRR